MRSTRVRAEPLLRVESLGVRYGAEAPALADVSLALEAGASLGILGESGSGKSQLALAIAGLLPPGATLSGAVRLKPGARLGVVFQDPQAALAPHLTIGTQLTETLAARQGLGRAAARAEALALLERVQVGEPALRLRQYPHELSGGLRQRALIAIALATRPELLILDEPTTALDVTVEAGILALFRRLRAELGVACVLIGHDLAVVGSLCERIVVLYRGRIVEAGEAGALFARPQHPYTASLVAASPRLDGPLGALAPAPVGPVAADTGAGCPYLARCPRRIARCEREAPALVATARGGEVACHLPAGPGA